MMAFERILSGALGLALLALAGLTQAEPSAAKRETARELMAEGRQLRERGDLQGALSRFSAADAIMNVPTTGFEVAAAQADLGKVVEARESLLRVLGTAPAEDEPAPFKEARAKARTLYQQLLARIGSLVFAVGDVSEADELELRVDGEVVPRAMLGLRFRVNPGRRQVVARSQGRELWREVDVGEGEVVDVTLTFGKPPLSVEARERAAPLAPAGPRRPPTKSRRAVPRAAPESSAPTLAYVGIGVGVLGTAVGSAAGISAIVHRNAAAKACIDSRCPPSTWRDLQTARNMAIAADIGFLVGGVGLAFAVGAFLLDGPSRPKQSWLVAPEVGRRGAALNVEGRF